MTYRLVLNAPPEETYRAAFRFRPVSRPWLDPALLVATLIAGAVAASLYARLHHIDALPGFVVGLVSATVALAVWLRLQRRRIGGYLAVLKDSANSRTPTPILLDDDGFTLEARRFDWSDIAHWKRSGELTLLCFSDFDGIVIRDLDLPPDLTPQDLAERLAVWRGVGT